MDCLRSFIIKIEQNSTFTAPDVKTWDVAGRQGWIYDNNTNSSTFNVQGFKNIEIYGIQMIGTISNQESAVLGNVNVNDWSMEIQLNGQLPLLGGVVAPVNFFNIYTTQFQASRFSVSKYTPEVKLASPITSVQSIQFQRLIVSGSDWDTVNTASLEYKLSFVFYYRFEGE